MSNLFGRIIDGSVVDDALLAHCKKWIPTYLREVERQRTMTVGAIALPKSYLTLDDPMMNNPGLGFPVCAVTVARETGYGMNSDSELSAWYDAGVEISFMSNNANALRRRLHMYNAAIRSSLIQHPSLGGLAEAIEPGETSYLEIPGTAANNMTYAHARFEFRVKVHNIVDRFGGPLEPIEQPVTDPGNWPSVEDVETTIEEKDLADEL